MSPSSISTSSSSSAIRATRACSTRSSGAIHTIKGTCGFLGLVRLETVSHTAESVLDRIREGELTANPGVISDILAAIDTIKLILVGLRTVQCEPAGDDAPLVEALNRWLSCANLPPAPRSEARVPDMIVSLADTSAAPPSSLRVGVDILDSLMNLAGELVLTRNRLQEMALKDEASPYAVPIQQLARITSDLQGEVMKTRLQPVASAWAKLPRIVRDAARDAGKKIELDMKGADTALDRQLVHAIQDPLTHMVRNSVDHGIELPASRMAAGKPVVGRIRLNAYHEGGHVVVELSDDGAGIDIDRVREKVLARGLTTVASAASLSDSQLLQYIFAPGFSTSDAVTHMSGRGVGMDVVRSNIERVGGSVTVESASGVGCTVRIRLPLTLAIVSSLLVVSSGEWFALPQASVLELVRVPAGAFDELNGARIFRLRGSMIPVIDLSRALRLAPASTGEARTLVVCQVAGSRYGILVDDVADTQEIVVKPLSRRVRSLGCYAGSTILGDGRVIMIVEPAGLAALSNIRVSRAAQDASAASEERAHRDTLLVFDAGFPAQQAVELSRVARLEEIAPDRIEVADGRYLVQYRGSLLPLVAYHPSVSITSGQSRSVIVFNDGSTSFGIAVNEIKDIVEDSVNIELPPSRPGVLGTAVIAGAATELVDVSYFSARARGILVS